LLQAIGAKTVQSLESVGQFARFTLALLRALGPALVRWRVWMRTMPQLFEVGNRTVPVIAVTGTFVGLVLAIQSYDQLRAAGFEEHMGVLLSLSLVKELGPVLAGVMLAGRVGGAFTAELGTMRVTDQIDALRVMGADPMPHLVAPRFIACLVFAPLLTVFCILCGSMAGWFIAVVLKNIPASPYWYHIEYAVEMWDLMEGFVKSLAFGGAIGLIACYKGFHCRPGAEGVGRACTESFVSAFVVILAVDFFLAAFLSGLYRTLHGVRPLIPM
jgi:phospholipid/cholesterol/gamma-HCH transport system permease protein